MPGRSRRGSARDAVLPSHVISQVPRPREGQDLPAVTAAPWIAYCRSSNNTGFVGKHPGFWCRAEGALLEQIHSQGSGLPGLIFLREGGQGGHTGQSSICKSLANLPSAERGGPAGWDGRGRPVGAGDTWSPNLKSLPCTSGPFCIWGAPPPSLLQCRPDLRLCNHVSL